MSGRRLDSGGQVDRSQPIRFTFDGKAWTGFAGDTIGLQSTLDGDRFASILFVQAGDTMVNVKNCTQYSDNKWHDNAVDNFGLSQHLAVFPIVVRQFGMGVEPISNKGFSLFGHFPNPASNVLNVKIGLNKSDDVELAAWQRESAPESSQLRTRGGK